MTSLPCFPLGVLYFPDRYYSQQVSGPFVMPHWCCSHPLSPPQASHLQSRDAENMSTSTHEDGSWNTDSFHLPLCLSPAPLFGLRLPLSIPFPLCGIASCCVTYAKNRCNLNVSPEHNENLCQFPLLALFPAEWSYWQTSSSSCIRLWHCCQVNPTQFLVLWWV